MRPITIVCRNFSCSSTRLSTTEVKEQNVINKFSDIPTEKGLLPAFVRLLLDGGPGYLHEHCDRLHRKLGPIFRNKLGSKELVFLADSKLMQYVMAHEGQHPHHTVPEAWLYYNQIKNLQRGLFFQTGEPWAKLRRAFDKVMLADPKKTTRFSSDIIDINNDLLDSWQLKNGKRSTEEVEIADVKRELCKWSIEATGFMLFGSRMECISKTGKDNPKGEQLVHHVATMFEQTSNFQILPVKFAHRYNLGTWQKFEHSSAEMLRIANDYASEFIDKAKKSSSNVSLAKDLIDQGALSGEEITRSMIDLIIAAADTTSNSMQWMLYLLAKYPDCQDRIITEAKQLLSGSFLNYRETAPFLLSFIKEASRLYPTAPFLARILEKDIVLANYNIPAGTPLIFSLYTTSRMEQYFDRPLEFNPDRWNRTVNRDVCPRAKAKRAYASLPFGVGVRMCIGRRAAELEMCLFIASLVDRFKVYPIDSRDVEIKLKMILCPKYPIGVKLEAR